MFRVRPNSESPESGPTGILGPVGREVVMAPEPMPVPEDLGTDDNGNQWERTQFSDDGDGDFTIGWTITIGGK